MNILRWLIVMYNRKVYRNSREFDIERQCKRMERNSASK